MWVKLQHAPKYLFGFCYVLPADSQYYSHESFSSIQEKVKTSETCKEFCILGDMNARFGQSVLSLLDQDKVPGMENFSYPVLPDNVPLPNENAFILSSVCKESELLVLNILEKPTNHFKSKKTYKQGTEWISELDTCILSPSAVSGVSEFSVIHNVSLPSDQAPISVTLSLPDVDLESLYTRAYQLGNYSIHNGVSSVRKVIKPIRLANVDERLFLHNIQLLAVPMIMNNINDDVNNVTNIV